MLGGFATAVAPRSDTALLAPICRNGIKQSREIFLCQPCLGPNLKDPPLARVFNSGNISDLPGGVPYSNQRSAAARSTPTSARHARRGVHWSVLLINDCILNWRLKVALKTFFDHVCRQVIERHLLNPLPQIFCREELAAMNND